MCIGHPVPRGAFLGDCEQQVNLQTRIAPLILAEQSLFLRLMEPAMTVYRQSSVYVLSYSKMEKISEPLDEASFA